MKTNFGLHKYHQYSITELELMYPWERKIELALLMNWLSEEKQKQDRRNAK